MANPMTFDAIAERFTELEMRVAFQDHTLGELNVVVTAQEQRIVQLVRALTLLKEQMHILAPSLNAPAGEEPPPPHY